ncbi:type II secretion system protein [Blautia sp. HCP3S3_H10_1]|uniref:type II secretion system protein n=1 Tax=unclassified Blautia TaxID=2648079 RepID=UPI003F907489
MNLYDKNKNRKGYTLAEVLLTVAILLVLMAIAIPAIFAIQRNLRQKALDNKAELIYTAVQNNLVKMQSNGNSSLYAKDKANPVTANPSDADGDKSSILYYVTASERETSGNVASVLVTKDTVDDDLYNHYWVVEYNPDSASVYAVFYSETRDNYDTITYNSLRYKKARLADGAEVGYYGGDMIAGGNTSTLAPTLTITNEEKLVATISCKRPDANDLLFDVTMEDSEGHSLTLRYKAQGGTMVHRSDDMYVENQPTSKNEEGTVRGIRYELKLTLDDLKNAESRFSNLYSSNKVTDMTKRLTPGSSLKITATVKSSGAFADSAEVSATTNSLFADNSSENEAVIMYGRHLQNLDQTSGVTNKITSAIQQKDIHFEKQDDLDEETENTSSWYSCYKDKTFTPITNNNLTGYSANYSVDTNGNTPVIYHLNVANENKAGLFATLKDGMTVDSVRLSGTSITGNHSENSVAGAVAGEAAGAVTLRNCQVFLSNEDVTGKTEADYWITGAKIQGGLIGRTYGNVTIDKCFASTVMGATDATQVGGMIGRTGVPDNNSKATVTVTNSYTDSYLTGAVTGGVIAASESEISINLNSCYTVGYQTPLKNGGGLVAKVGRATGADMVNCYSAVKWNTVSNTSQSGNAEIASLASGTARNSYFLNGGTDYMKAPGEFGENSGRGTKVDYKTLSNRTAMAAKLGEAFTSTAVSTNAYNLKNQGLTGYSYPALKDIAHYGDWEATFESGSLVYYEIYREGENVSYGVFGGNMPSTLSDDKTIIGDGYGVAYEAGAEIPSDKITIFYETKDKDTLEKGEISTADDAIRYSVTVNSESEEKTYYVYPLSSEIVNAQAIPDTYYQKLVIQGEGAVGVADTDESAEEISGSVFYYNPHFAKTAVNATEAPAVPTNISIRTARQLYHLSLYYPDYAEKVKNSTFFQETNIDYRDYSWNEYAGVYLVQVQEPIGVRNKNITPFTAAYNGNCYEIRGISFSTSATTVGFIGENRRLVQNVFLVSDYEEGGSNPYLEYQGTIGTNKTIYMGALVGVNSGRIQNCAVSGYTMNTTKKVFVRSNGTFYFGGLTGSNSGTILNCEADTPLINAEILYGNAYLAGFAGENASGGRIRNSYAIGHIMIENAKGGKTVISGFASRNAGYLGGDYCTVALTASGANTTSYGFSPRGNVSDCSYLSGGTFRYIGELYAFDNENGGGTKKSYKDMEVNSENDSRCHSATGSDSNLSYPFKTVITDKEGNARHYGNWEIKENLGAIGIVYWELEQGGSNDGYHFSYKGYKGNDDALEMISGSTLCRQHDDGGVITEYGYGYYYASIDGEDWSADTSEGANVPKINEKKDFQTGNWNSEASQALSSRLDGFTVVAYTTKPAIGTADSDDYMCMVANERSVANGEWTFLYQGLKYTFTFNPFFANAMQYGTSSDNGMPKSLSLTENGIATQAESAYPMPGTAECKYEIRSDDQLEYLNWNCSTKNAITDITSNNTNIVEGYTYLGYMYTAETRGDQIGSANYFWNQTHDVDANMKPNETTELFYPIGSLFDANGSADGNAAARADAYMAFFSGAYNGNTYSIKNIEINSGNTAVGLFGCIIGANVENVVLYSDNGNYIQRTSDAKTWYVMGGLCGLAAVGQEKESGSVYITNCTVSGYNIQDNSTKSAWGDACIGGMFGMSTMDLKKCTAVNNIILNTEYTNGKGIKTDGVSVRTGGLVGSMRGKISDCYTGGEISITPRCLENARQSYGSKLFLGGITGGICMRSGNFLKLLGKTVLGVTGWTNSSKDTTAYGAENGKKCETNTTEITNCYTYIKMPSKNEEINRIKSIEPIGSNGETPFENQSNYHVKVLVKNCYYYGNNIPKTKEFQVKDHSPGYTTGTFWNSDLKQNVYREWTNIDSDAKPITWKQLAGIEKINGKTLVELLNENQVEENKFSTVTTSENGQDVDGKYTFPGNHGELDGENYPFPTILKQNGNINIHYGEWPLEGIYWEENRATMDIFEDLQVEDTTAQTETVWAEKEFRLLDPVPVLAPGYNQFTISYSNGEDDTNTAVASFAGEDGEANIATFSDGDSEIGDSEGFSSGGDSDVSQVGASTESAQQTEEPGTVELTGEDLIAEVRDIRYDEVNKCYIATVRALRTGATIITVTAKDVNGNEYRASFNLSVSADLSVSTDPEKLEMNTGETAAVKVHANAASSPILDGEDVTEVQSAGNDGWVAGSDDEAIDENSYVDIVTDNEAEEVAAGTAQTTGKDLASRMTWTITSDDPDIIGCTAVSGGRFSVQCYGTLDAPVTLTVTGTYTYNNVDYSGIAWVEVTTKNEAEIRWNNANESVVLNATTTATNPVKATFFLEDATGCLAETLALSDFTVTNEVSQQNATEDEVVAQAASDVGASVVAIEKVTDGYNVTVAVSAPGTYRLTVNAKGKDNKDYSAFCIFTAQTKIAATNGTDETNQIISSDTPTEDSGFTSEESNNQEDQNNEGVDMIPNQEADGFSDDLAGWEG